MRFYTYLRRFGKLIKLYKVHRSDKGLYVWTARSNDYTSYHEDGRYWNRVRGSKWIKKLRQPLSTFTGTETFSVATVMVFAPKPDDEDESSIGVKPDDIVPEFPATFGIEIILSSEKVDLPPLPQRSLSVLHVKESVFPVITIEAFPITDGNFAVDRYPGKTPWIEGTNFFIDHKGRI